MSWRARMAGFGGYPSELHRVLAPSNRLLQQADTQARAHVTQQAVRAATQVAAKQFGQPRNCPSVKHMWRASLEMPAWLGLANLAAQKHESRQQC